MRRLPLLLPLCLITGCVTLVQSRYGETIDPSGVEAVEPGRTTLREALAALGAPREVHLHPDGMLCVWRYKARNAFRLGLDASEALRVVDASQVVSETLKNFRLTLESINQQEDRLVLYVDREGVVRGKGFQLRTPDLPLF